MQKTLSFGDRRCITADVAADPDENATLYYTNYNSLLRSVFMYQNTISRENTHQYFAFSAAATALSNTPLVGFPDITYANH